MPDAYNTTVRADPVNVASMALPAQLAVRRTRKETNDMSVKCSGALIEVSHVAAL